MPFPEPVKLAVKRSAHFYCCLCRTLGVEVHHILPQAEGGCDTEENAAPLCPSCHETYGANPDKRKFIREARDLWYEICAKRYSGDADQLREIQKRLETVATKEDLNQLAVRNMTYTLGPSGTPQPLPWQYLRYSFQREEFVHPLIVRELLGWISDVGSTVVAIDLGLANRSNQFFGDFSVEMRDGRVWPKCTREGGEFFVYSYIATSPSGVHMLECYDYGGGSGVFSYVALLAFESDRCLDQNTSSTMAARNRILLKILGSVHLGDRYSGSIEYRDGKLVIGPDTGWFARGEAACQEIAIE